MLAVSSELVSRDGGLAKKRVITTVVIVVVVLSVPRRCLKSVVVSFVFSLSSPATNFVFICALGVTTQLRGDLPLSLLREARMKCQCPRARRGPGSWTLGGCSESQAKHIHRTSAASSSRT